MSNAEWYPSTEERPSSGGVWLAALVIPVAIVAWLVVSQLGYVSSLVTWGAAVLAVFLYGQGSKGALTAEGMRGVCVVIGLAVLGCLVGEVVFGAARQYSHAQGGSPLSYLGDPAFWPWLVESYLSTATTWEAFIPVALTSAAFAVLGAVPALWTAWNGPGSGVGIWVVLALITGVVWVLFVLLPSRDQTPPVPDDPTSSDLILKVGDCVDRPAGAQTPDARQDRSVPCAEPHSFETYFVGELGAPASQPYPGDAAVNEQASQICGPPFGAFVGTPIELSSLAVQMQYPSEGSWKLSIDRHVACMVTDPAQPTTTGTLAEAAR